MVIHSPRDLRSVNGDLWACGLCSEIEGSLERKPRFALAAKLLRRATQSEFDAFCEHRSAHFVANTAFCEPRSASCVAGAAFCAA